MIFEKLNFLEFTFCFFKYRNCIEGEDTKGGEPLRRSRSSIFLKWVQTFMELIRRESFSQRKYRLSSFECQVSKEENVENRVNFLKFKGNILAMFHLCWFAIFEIVEKSDSCSWRWRGIEWGKVIRKRIKILQDSERFFWKKLSQKNLRRRGNGWCCVSLLNFPSKNESFTLDPLYWLKEKNKRNLQISWITVSSILQKSN